MTACSVDFIRNVVNGAFVSCLRKLSGETLPQYYFYYYTFVISHLFPCRRIYTEVCHGVKLDIKHFSGRWWNWSSIGSHRWRLHREHTGTCAPCNQNLDFSSIDHQRIILFDISLRYSNCGGFWKRLKSIDFFYKILHFHFAPSSFMHITNRKFREDYSPQRDYNFYLRTAWFASTRSVLLRITRYNFLLDWQSWIRSSDKMFSPRAPRFKSRQLKNSDITRLPAWCNGTRFLPTIERIPLNL